MAPTITLEIVENDGIEVKSVIIKDDSTGEVVNFFCHGAGIDLQDVAILAKLDRKTLILQLDLA